MADSHRPSLGSIEPTTHPTARGFIAASIFCYSPILGAAVLSAGDVHADRPCLQNVRLMRYDHLTEPVRLTRHLIVPAMSAASSQTWEIHIKRCSDTPGKPERTLITNRGHHGPANLPKVRSSSCRPSICRPSTSTPFWSTPARTPTTTRTISWTTFRPARTIAVSSNASAGKVFG